MFALTCFTLSPIAQAVVPAPDGGYPGGNTAEGQNALLSLTSGLYNTAVGLHSLGSVTTGNYNTGVGTGTLASNTANENTATGTGALLSNTRGVQNTANGAFALVSNTAGGFNTAVGDRALQSNTGDGNTAIGYFALYSNTSGGYNTAIGYNVLFSNTGNNNIALGTNAGSNVTTADNVICIGANVAGNNVDHSCFIGEIFGSTSSNGVPVLVNSNGRLGTMTSSRRFKEEIKPMDKASEVLLALKPVTFRYKKGIDPQGIPQFGLVAEEVEKVNPDLVVRDNDGKSFSVRYDQVNAMLLNEFLKEHRKVEKLEATVAQEQKSFQAKLAEQNKQIAALASSLQRVSARVEMSKPATKVVSTCP